MTALAAPKSDLWPIWQASDASSTVSVDHARWQKFLDRYLVTDQASGVNLVKYSSVSEADRADLGTYLQSLQSIDPRALNSREQLAYWINLYNAATVRVVLDNPGKRSILRMGQGLFSIGPWDDELLEVAAIELTLNDVEHRILRPIWRDHRVHFAVNCASLSCPNLAAEAYTADNVDRLLGANESAYINDARGVSFTENGRLELSSIFDWYRDDFAANEAGLLDYLMRHAAEPLATALAAYDGRIRYEYDWALNAAR